MTEFRRRAAIGAAAGLIASPLLLATKTEGHAVVLILLGALAGLAYGCLATSGPDRLDAITTGAAAGLPFWAFAALVILPLLHGDGPAWELGGAQDRFPDLVGWVLFGGVVGALAGAIRELVGGRFAAPVMAPPAPAAPTRIVVLGGGFAGVTTAQYLEEVFGADPAVAITLVSDTNALLFTPMLAEVAASSLEASHISSPLRTTLRRTRVLRGRVSGVDLDRRTVTLAPAHDAPHDEPYDQLVLALGAVSNYLGMKGVEAEAFDFKSLEDAIRIRNHVIEMFDRADREPDPATRQALLTFVVAGGGFAGAELAGGLNDFARGMLPYYPALAADDLRIVLIHSRERILPELSDALAGYALDRMRARGVEFKLSTRVADARRGVVVLNPSEELRTETLVWTAGTRPNPLLDVIPMARDKRGAVVVDATMAVPGRPELWAIGDCAAVPNAFDGQTSPPTAQFALRQAKTLATNLHATLHGKPLKPFRFKPIGALCVVGHHTACAEVYGRRFSGLFAWLMWRGIYVGKLPGLERKVHVLADWVIELFFPRDIVQTLSVTRERAPAATAVDEPGTTDAGPTDERVKLAPAITGGGSIG